MGNSGSPLKLNKAPSATPTSDSLSIWIVAARKIQSGIQFGPGRRRQLVRLAL